MSIGRRWIGFLTALVLTVCAVFLCARPLVLEWLSVLDRGTGLQSYQAAAVGEDGTACAAGWDGETLLLTFFDLEGRRLEQWGARLPEQVRGGTVAGLYPVGTQTVLCGLYTQSADRLEVYLLEGSGGVSCLLSQPCPGESGAQRRAGTALLSFSRNGDQVCFVLRDDEGLTGYAWQRESSGVRMLAQSGEGDARGAAVLPDGTLAVAGAGTLTLGGAHSAGVGEEQRPVLLTQTGTGLYYVDAAALELYYSDLTGSAVRQVLSLDPAVQGHSLTWMSVTGQGDALLLLDGHHLTLVQKTGQADLTGALYPTARESALLLGLCALAALAAAWVIWYVLCGLVCKNRLSMLVQGGAVLLAAGLLAGVLLYWGYLLPGAQRQALERDQMATDSLVRLLLTEQPATEADLADWGQALSGALEAGGIAQNVSVVWAHWTGTHWLDQAGNRAELSPAFHGALAGQAQSNGTAVLREDGVFRYALTQGNWQVCVCFDSCSGAPVPLWQGVAAAMTLVVAVGLLFLLAVSRNARRLSQASERLAEEKALDRPLRLRSGDELEGVAAILDSLSGAVTRSREEQEQLARSYRRFVPERLLSLLGKQSIREVDKGTFATRRMAVMMVWFQFPEPVYSGSGNTRLLFDSINEIIERTASIAAAKGGTVFNFAYSGYDVVMDDCPALVSAAVAMAQEVLSFNSLRSREGLPTVSFRMALDVGDVLLGVVGDNTQMQPTAISTSFSAVRGLISLCSKLQANILCTEAVISGAGEYAYRYMGKCLQDDLPVRVYEIFSGDEYEVRRAKQATVRRFSQGVLALYSGETLQAKRIFLELAHQNSRDGGVRHYLYLADRLEKDPGRPCSLDG